MVFPENQSSYDDSVRTDARSENIVSFLIRIPSSLYFRV